MKKDFLQFVTEEETKSELAKLATKVWITFRYWWDKNKNRKWRRRQGKVFLRNFSSISKRQQNNQ